jgi:hypothetical protein
MCAYALHISEISRVVYSCNNDKFGGAGGMLQLNKFPAIKNEGKSFEILGGLKRDEAVLLLKEFYESGNERAPPDKRMRTLKLTNIPSIYSGEPLRNFFVTEVAKVARYAVPSVQSIKLMLD